MGTQVLFVLLCTLQYIQGTPGSELVDSLTCVNNYKTHWRCQWKLRAETHQLLPMNLIHWNNVTSNSIQLCEPDNPGEKRDGEVYLTCQFNDKFSYVMTTTCSLQPKRDMSRNTLIIPNNKVRMLPPEGLMVQKSDLKNGSIILRWRKPDNISYYRHLLYQVTYLRQDWESWEDAAVLNVMGKTEVSFSPEQLVPGSTYLFRVRSVPDKDPRYRSAWCNPIAWTVPEEEDKAIPQNLHCEYDGFTQMKCIWEVRKELSSVPYMLYYQDGTAKTSTLGEKPCHNLSSHMKVGALYILYSCTFHILPSQAKSNFHIRVGPKMELKEFKACNNIQTDPPTDLQMKDELHYKYKLGWSPPVVAVPTIKLIYQLCFWKQGDEECPDLLLKNVSGNVLEYYIPNSELLGSTYYIAKVRAKPDDGSGYNGPWSEWSQTYSWKTEKAMNTVVISVSTFIISVVFLLCIYLWLICFRRLKRQWENSIPDPGKSKLSKFPLEYSGSNFPRFINRDLYAEVEGPLVSWQISPIESPHPACPGSEQFVAETPSKPNVSPLGPYSMSPPTAEKVHHLQACTQFEESCDLKGTPLLQPTERLSKMGRSSPYFNFTRAKSMSDLIAKELDNQKFSDYFMLPKCENKVFSPPEELIPSCQTVSPGNQMSYVLNMEKKPTLQIPTPDDDKHESRNSNYFTIPLPSEVQVSQEGPLMIINPDGTGPLVLKQVGDYCFFPGVRGSQENLEKKKTPANGNMHLQMAKVAPLPPVQTFKIMQRDYLALPKN
ncbi:hypothetical protein GDO81_018190 [Engystomops pustulosus]|uniref:Fibronectin type-III domain-containing protein n=1 Tax=Engystomops pustulosus TaxID=76066 RepID=A0AAV7A582_ENGPU|nr:hypothetical protein GDO81_018190 [Engystomops pustulosus]KAG8556741.1 hypothetical protein GDO81_018190 [Engystomops pustulosus]